MIFELADDLRQAVDCMPQTHPAFEKLTLLNEAVCGSILGLAERPRAFTQTVTNFLRRRPIALAASELIDKGEALLTSLDWWLRAEDGIAETKQWECIVAVSPCRWLVHCARGDHRIVDCHMVTQQVVSEQSIPTEKVMETAVCPSDGQVASVTADGVIHTAEGIGSISLRQRSHCFAGLAKGFIGVDAKADLIYWDSTTTESIRLASEMPVRGCSVSVSSCGDAAVVIAGDRPGMQRVLVIGQAVDGVPVCRAWVGDGRIVTAACIDAKTGLLVLATVDRRLAAFDLESGSELGTIALSQSPGRPLGEVIRCACIEVTGVVRVVFADSEGVIGLWDVRAAQIKRVGRYHSLDSPEPLICLDWLPHGRRFVVATRHILRMISSDEQLDIDVSTGTTAVTACAIGVDGWVTLVQEKTQRVTWIRDGSVRDTYYHPWFRPQSIASTGLDGEVLVGGHGTLAMLHPGRQPIPSNALDVFDRHVTAILPWDTRTTAAVSEAGEIKLVRMADDWVKPTQPPTFYWQQAGACRLGDSREIVCWGRTISGASNSRIYVASATGRIQEVFRARDLVVDVASTCSGPLIHVALHDEVIAYIRRGTSWEPATRRKERVSLLAALGPDYLAVVLAERNWIEVWATTDSLRTVAMCYAPISPRISDGG